MKNTLITLLVIFLICLNTTIPVVLAKTSSSSGSIESLSKQDAAYKVKYLALKQKYLNEVAFFKQAKQDYQTAKQKYLASKSLADQQVLTDEGKAFLKQVTVVIIARLQVLRNWVVNEPGMNEADRNASLKEIDDDIAYLQTQESKIDGYTVEQLKASALDIKNHWLTIRKNVKSIVGRVLLARTNYIIEKADQFSAKVSAKITELKTKGENTTQLESWLADFNKNLDLAKQKRDQATKEFNQANSVGAMEQLFKNVNQSIKEANKYILEAYKQLKEIVKNLDQEESSKTSKIKK